MLNCIAEHDNAYTSLKKKENEFLQLDKEYKELRKSNLKLLSDFNDLTERSQFLETQHQKSGQSIEEYSKQIFELEQIIKSKNEELNTQVNMNLLIASYSRALT